ncbi:pectinesterase family protein [Sphingobacterium pedocola]|uniref:Pectinesterase n=1 Tax=Sphingobacterium pedocola TaxID=2082722 RepID=A0ABR9TEG7_9SPHI|nr:pectinesterase family protein [Sphingobacterium pedocola]MBE8723052.1 pectin esterase [Sphingobacterium pedocola]
MKVQIRLAFLFLLLLTTIFSGCVMGKVKIDQYDITVDKSGKGDYKTLQEAIDAVPNFRKSITHILIKNGEYKEKIVLAESKQNIHFVGESRENVRITYDDYASKKNAFGEELGTSGSAGFYIYGIDIYFENITFANTAGPVGQAVAVLVAGDKVQFYRCSFLGFQDTLYTYGKQSRQYYLECYIEGTVDFIFGSSTALFDKCVLFGKKGGYYTAASTPEGREFGYVFRYCELKGDTPTSTFLLGRPWRPYAKTVFLHCRMDDVVAPRGWDNWGKVENEHTVYYAEYKSIGKGAYATDRVAWSKSITDQEAAKYTVGNVLGDWTPFKAISSF